MIFLFFSLPMAISMGRPFLITLFGNCPLPLNGASVGTQKVAASTIDDAFTPVEEALCALRFRNCLAQFKQLYITHVLDHSLDFSLNGLCRHFCRRSN